MVHPSCQNIIWLTALLLGFVNYQICDAISACNYVEYGWLPIKVGECSYGYVNGTDISYKATCRPDGVGEFTTFTNTIFCDVEDEGVVAETIVLSNGQCDATYECEVYGAKYISYTNVTDCSLIEINSDNDSDDDDDDDDDETNVFATGIFYIADVNFDENFCVNTTYLNDNNNAFLKIDTSKDGLYSIVYPFDNNEKCNGSSIDSFNITSNTCLNNTIVNGIDGLIDDSAWGNDSESDSSYYNNVMSVKWQFVSPATKSIPIFCVEIVLLVFVAIANIV